MTSGKDATGNAEADASARRRPHSVRFLDPEWERIEAFAEARGFTGPEFVRYAALAAMAEPGEITDRLAPLIETTFRATHILVTKMRDDMVDAGRAAELDQLVEGAWALQDRLLRKGPD
ncbi:MAG: hypothetical protein F4Y60_05015 [Boseongicola sp. SB0664_bin_43]|uniref:Uncharacterized protein n=1 Tax=Boseongicola sp. SB0664_bin_43 TaxID=2604844 RepID=A0A6B0XXI9_9RHOB|nr:hypothetical protein [Boseongicola sp. SB0664_bin_43]MYI06785.1 hypothetical protein [Gemmatimonadota bacterium]